MIMKRENSFKATFPSHIKDVKDGSNKWFLYNGSISLLLFWSAVKVRSLLRCFTNTTDEAQLKEIYIYIPSNFKQNKMISRTNIYISRKNFKFYSIMQEREFFQNFENSKSKTASSSPFKILKKGTKISIPEKLRSLFLNFYFEKKEKLILSRVYLNYFPYWSDYI